MVGYNFGGNGSNFTIYLHFCWYFIYTVFSLKEMDNQTYDNILLSLTIVTLCIQAYVIFLVQFHSPKQMAQYGYYLNKFTVSFTFLCFM